MPSEKEFSVGLAPLTWALVHYFAKKRRQSPAEVIERMVRLYADADRRMVAQEFLDFVRNELLVGMELGPARDVVLRQTVQFSKQRQMADETTASHVNAKAHLKRRPDPLPNE